MRKWNVTRFYHAVLNTRDIKRSVAFYSALGLEVIHDRASLKWPAIFGKLFGVGEGKQGAGVLMGVPNDPTATMLDIIEWKELEDDLPDTKRAGSVAPRIFAFRVDNIREAYKDLSALGHRFTEGGLFDPAAQASASSFTVSNIRGSCFLYDPDGYLVELIELRPGARHSQDSATK